jgi:Protein of unknown function (DUF1566)
MYKLTKISADGTDLPADAEGHQVVRVERDLLARPLFVTAAIATESMTWQQAKKWAEGLTVYGWSWRLPTVEEAFMIPDRSRSEEPALDPAYFPDNYGRWIWTATEDAQRPAGVAWYVDLGLGSSTRYGRYAEGRVLAVRAGQF